MWLSPRFDDALLLASRHHGAQPRKGTGIPYLSHLLAVTALVLEAGGDQTEATGALLHDAVEDGGGPEMLAYIRAQFGDTVAAIVEANSDADTQPKPPWRERKEYYIGAIPTKSASAVLVSVADKLHNARAILLDYRSVGEPLWSRFNAGESGPVLWYYRELHGAFAARTDLGPGAEALVAELGRTVDELERLVSETAGGTRPD